LITGTCLGISSMPCFQSTQVHKGWLWSNLANHHFLNHWFACTHHMIRQSMFHRVIHVVMCSCKNPLVLFNNNKKKHPVGCLCDSLETDQCWLPVIQIRVNFHFVEHALNFGVISVGPFNAVLCFIASPLTHFTHECLETSRCKCQSVKGLIVLDPKRNVPSFVIFPTVHKISVCLLL